MQVHLQGDVSAGHFAQQLQAIGDRKVPTDPISGLISIPNDFCNIVGSIEELETSMFPSIRHHLQNHKWLCESVILASRNDSVTTIKLQIQDALRQDAVSYKSIEKVVDVNHKVQYPTKFLNSLQPPGMPPHDLVLKISFPIMLLRNLDPTRLCNGT